MLSVVFSILTYFSFIFLGHVSHDQVISGTVVSGAGNSPIAFASVCIQASSIGVITNEEGKFLLKIPDNLNSSKVVVQALGYERVEINPSSNQPVVVKLNLKPFVLQEVTVKAIKPESIIYRAIESKTVNYNHNQLQYQVYFKSIISATPANGYTLEAVADVHNFYPKEKFDIKIVKVRGKATNKTFEHEMNKSRPNIYTPLWLDVNYDGNWTDFIQRKSIKRYNYTFSSLTALGSDSLYVIEFKPKTENGKVLTGSEGIVFIDKKTFAIVGYDSNWNTGFIKKEFGMAYSYVDNDTEKTMSKVAVKVRYQKIGKKWYLQQAQKSTEQTLKTSKSSENLTRTAQLLVTKVDTANVKPFEKSEQMDFLKTKVHQVVGEYDDAFWGQYNTMPMPKTLHEF